MLNTIIRFAAGALLVAACSGADGDAVPSSPATTTAAATIETATTSAATVTVGETTSTEAVTTTEPPSTTTTIAATTTTTLPPGEMNPPDVEAWWCDAFRTAAGQNPTDFARGLADDFRHGYRDMPAETLEEGAEQAALVSCDPDYGRAVADALVP